MKLDKDTIEAEKKFNAAARKIDRMLLQLASGDDNRKQVVAAIDRLDSSANKAEIRGVDEVRERCQGRARDLRRRIADAEELGHKARRALRDAEIARLNEKIRASQPTGFEKELALMRGRGWR